MKILSGRITLRYLEGAIRDMARDFNVKPNQSILNFGKYYGSLTQKQNNENRLLNIEDAIEYMIEMHIARPDEVAIESRIEILQEELKMEYEKSKKYRSALYKVKAKIRMKRQQYKEEGII